MGMGGIEPEIEIVLVEGSGVEVEAMRMKNSNCVPAGMKEEVLGIRQGTRKGLETMLVVLLQVVVARTVVERAGTGVNDSILILIEMNMDTQGTIQGIRKEMGIRVMVVVMTVGE